MMKDSAIAELRSMLSKPNTMPIYHRLQGMLEEMIDSSTLTPGEMLPGDIELAKMLGVSPGTIRKAYSGLHKKSLIKRVQSIGTFVRDDMVKPKPTIGFFYNIEAQETRYHLAEQTQQLLAQRGYDLKIVAFRNDFYEQYDLYDEIQRMHLQGAIAVPLAGVDCKKSFLRLDKIGFPYVRLANTDHSGELRGTLVRGNERQAVADALRYLEELGHERIGLVTNYSHSEPEELYRVQSCGKDGFSERWIACTGFTGPFREWQQYPGRLMLGEYLESNPELTAVIVEHPAICIDLLHQAVASGRRVPADLSLVTLNAMESLDVVSPRITSMERAHRVMAEWCVAKVIEAIENGLPRDEQTIKVRYELRERESVASPIELAAVTVGS